MVQVISHWHWPFLQRVTKVVTLSSMRCSQTALFLTFFLQPKMDVDE